MTLFDKGTIWMNRVNSRVRNSSLLSSDFIKFYKGVIILRVINVIVPGSNREFRVSRRPISIIQVLKLQSSRRKAGRHFLEENDGHVVSFDLRKEESTRIDSHQISLPIRMEHHVGEREGGGAVHEQGEKEVVGRVRL